MFKVPGINLRDKERSIYHMWNGQFSYLVKLRPFVSDFIEVAMKNFEVYFYTAATRSYGDLALEVLRVELLAAFHEDLQFKKQIERTFVSNRLITRDDKQRFTEADSGGKYSDFEVEQLRKAERLVLSKG